MTFIMGWNRMSLPTVRGGSHSPNLKTPDLAKDMVPINTVKNKGFKAMIKT